MDIEKVLTALQVVDLARQWPLLSSLHDLAMVGLMKENELAKEELEKIAKEAYEKKLKEDEKAAAEAKAAADKEAKANAVPPGHAASTSKPGEK